MTARQTAQRSIPQMRTPPADGTHHRLIVTPTMTDGVGTITLSGEAIPGTLDALLLAIDGVFGADARGLVLDGAGVTTWSRRGLEIAVLTATRARGLRIAFAVCGLPAEQLTRLEREWPGIRSEWFAFTDRQVALEAVLARTD